MDYSHLNGGAPLTGPRCYMLNEQSGEKLYVASYSAWFDTVNQFHGSDPCPGLGISMRVDGVFSDAFKARMPALRTDRAATAAIWARMAD